MSSFPLHNWLLIISFLYMPSSKKIFYSISRRDLQTGIPKIDTISGHEKKEKETYFLLFTTPYCQEMLAVLSIVPTKAAFCLMTNEQDEMFPRDFKYLGNGYTYVHKCFQPLSSTDFTTLRVKLLMSISIHCFLILEATCF